MEVNLLIYIVITAIITCALTTAFLVFTKNKSQSKYQTPLEDIIEQLPGHIYWKDKNLNFIGSNENNWRDIGFKSLNDFIGKNDYSITPENEADKLRKIDNEVLNADKLKIAEETVTNNEGRRITYLSHKIPLKDQNKNIIGLLGVSLDVTKERQETYDKLHMLDNIISVMPGNVYWMDNNGIYLGCNDNQAKLIGLPSRRDIIGKRNIDLPGFLIAEVLDPINKAVIDKGESITIEDPAILPDGSEAIFLSSKVPLRNSRNEVIGMVGISLDITERKRLEKELKETQERVEGMLLMGASIAHELRTPLSTLSLGLDNLKWIVPSLAESFTPSDEITQDDLTYTEKLPTTLKKTVHSAFMIIDMLLMRLKQVEPETSGSDLFSISDCMNRAIEEYPFTGKQKELVHWDTKNAFTVKGKEEYMRHVIFNLIKNALYFTHKAKKGDIHIWLEKGTDSHTLYFKDTGTGMPQEDTTKVFDHFFTKTYHGAGIGLAFCKMVMESIGGGIRCESKEGEYTLFTLTFPIIKE